MAFNATTISKRKGRVGENPHGLRVTAIQQSVAVDLLVFIIFAIDFNFNVIRKHIIYRPIKIFRFLVGNIYRLFLGLCLNLERMGNGAENINGELLFHCKDSFACVVGGLRTIFSDNAHTIHQLLRIASRFLIFFGDFLAMQTANSQPH